MRVVSNTSPVSNLAIIGRLSLLPERYGRVVVPPEVRRELSALSHVAARQTITIAFREAWLVEESIPDPNPFEELRRTLDRGEAAAIALAATTNADILLIDERRGRIEARAFHLKIAGILGELLHAKFAGRLPSVQAEILKLRSEAHFFIHSDLERFIVSQAGE